MQGPKSGTLGRSYAAKQLLSKIQRNFLNSPPKIVAPFR
jgi:hypothetical protein